MFRAAQLVGQALSDAKEEIDRVVKDESVYTDATLLLSGSIGGRRPRLFQIYGAGNFIECQSDTPFLQIGETKYGKPVLDRMLTYETPMGRSVEDRADQLLRHDAIKPGRGPAGGHRHHPQRRFRSGTHPPHRGG